MSKRAITAAKQIYADGIKLVGRRDKANNLVIHPEIMVGILRTACQRGYEQAEKDTIERAVKWLAEHAKQYVGQINEPFWTMFIKHFRKAMEEE